jgi:uncharacterized protein with NRDE domain
MCTVTYIPLDKESFILTSNRDESPSRQAEELYFEKERKLIYPKVPNFSGSWICISANDKVACLLNGAFEKHSHQPPYKKSRGLMLLDVFDYNSFDDFVDDFDIVGMEPFTLIFYEKKKLYEFRWDGTFTHKTKLATDKAYIWSSSTLYNAEMKDKRESWFEMFLKDNEVIDSASILNFHENAGEGNSEIDLIMNRLNGKVCTISISQILKTEDNIQFFYKNKIDNTNLISNISII